jgi:hypothetical protein
MGQKSEPLGFDQVYVLGLDDRGHPRGARFSVLKDSIVSAAMDLNCRVLFRQPEPVSKLGMKLPLGRVFGRGKVVTLFVPNIGCRLYKQILEALQVAAMQERTQLEAAISRVIH